MRRTTKQSLVAALAAATAVAGILAMPAASAATPPPPRTGTLAQLAGTDGCIQDAVIPVASREGCATGSALQGAGSSAVTSDGAFVFVAGTTGGGSITTFTRDQMTGALTQASCLTALAVTGCATLAEISGLASITINHADDRLYAPIPATAKVLILTIGAGGVVTRTSGPTGCVQNSPTPSQTCSPGSGIPVPTAVALTPTDSSFYVVSRSNGTASGSLAVFDVDPDTAASVFRSCLQTGADPTPPPCDAADGLTNARAVAVTGSNVYVAAFGTLGTGAVALATDSGGPGPAGLAETACYGTLPTCTAARAVGGASDVVVSPDGTNVYVGATDRSTDGSIIGGGVALFVRNATDGTLTQPTGEAGCIVQTTVTASNTCARGRGLKGVGSLVASPDNRNVYTAAALNNPAGTANTGSSAVAILERSATPTVGILAQPTGTEGCFSSQTTDGCALARGLKSPGAGPHSLVLTPTGSFLYAAAATSQAVAAFAPQGSDLRLTAAPQAGPYSVGQAYSITLTVTNAGALPATNVRLTDAIGPGGAIIGATPSQGSCTVNPTVCTLGTLAVDASATVVIRWQPTGNGTQTNVARVQADQGDASRADNVATTSLASGPTTLAVVSGAGQTAKVSTSFAAPIKVSLKDNAGAALQGQQVTFTAPGGTGASAFFATASSETVVTDANGIATSSVPVANSVVGTYSVTVSSASAVSQSVALTNSATDPTPSPSSTVSPSPGAQRLGLFLTSPATITPGTPSTWRGTGPANAAVTLRCYSRFPENSQPGSGTPAYFDARLATLSSTGSVTFSLNPGTNTRCFLRNRNAADGDATSSNSIAQNVATALSLSAYRDGVRQYHFQGRNLPRRAGQLITLYRVNEFGQEIRTATTTTDSTGIWRIDRRFTGSGSFNFRARTSQTLTNVAGVSNTRLTIIH